MPAQITLYDGATIPQLGLGVCQVDHGITAQVVGWAIKGDRKRVFARLIQDDHPTQPNAGLRARDGLLDDFPALADHLAGRPR